MPAVIQFRRDTAANWTSNNPTMASGEMGIETDTDKYKVGDGSTAWTFRVLQPGGWIIMQVPNAGGFAARAFRSRWSGWHVPIHLWHFTRTSLYRLLKSTGFESISCHYASVGTLALTLGVDGNTTGRLAVAVSDLGLDIAGAGDTLLVFAQRPVQQSHTTKPNVE